VVPSVQLIFYVVLIIFSFNLNKFALGLSMRTCQAISPCSHFPIFFYQVTDALHQNTVDFIWKSLIYSA